MGSGESEGEIGDVNVDVGGMVGGVDGNWGSGDMGIWDNVGGVCRGDGWLCVVGRCWGSESGRAVVRLVGWGVEGGRAVGGSEGGSSRGLRGVVKAGPGGDAFRKSRWEGHVAKWVFIRASLGVRR